jgi:hypothetical protein
MVTIRIVLCLITDAFASIFQVINIRESVAMTRLCKG